MTLRAHASEIGTVKSSTQILRNEMSRLIFENRELVKWLDTCFANWNLDMSVVEDKCKQVEWLTTSDEIVLIRSRQVGGGRCHHDAKKRNSGGNATWSKCCDPQLGVGGACDTTA